MSTEEEQEAYLKIYKNRSILVSQSGSEEVFLEGARTREAERRYNIIKRSLDNDFFKNVIEDCLNLRFDLSNISEEHSKLLSKLVDSVTSERGRAILGLTILQLVIKSIEPRQNIRLHKGGGGASRFSWADGLSMRAIDKNYITPLLREYDLLRMNADGFMMTRSLAENYPYTKLYKAALRGAKDEWLEIVELTERNLMDPKEALQHIIVDLLNRSNKFIMLRDETIANLKLFIEKGTNYHEVKELITAHIDNSSYSARLFEIALHSVYQVLEDGKFLGGPLKPLSQMRSANKKHGNVADIEVIGSAMTPLYILEAWDAKYGKPYLREELEELSEKLQSHSETELVGFVTNVEPNTKKEIVDRIEELEAAYSVKIIITSFNDWISSTFERADTSFDELSLEWLIAYVESLCLLRRRRAPIDEPVDLWVRELNSLLQSNVQRTL